MATQNWLRWLLIAMGNFAAILIFLGVVVVRTGRIHTIAIALMFGFLFLCGIWNLIKSIQAKVMRERLLALCSGLVLLWLAVISIQQIVPKLR